MQTNKQGWILSTLHEHGHKQTPLRTRIATYITEKKGIFSVQDITRAFPTMDKVTVYRTIDLFRSLDIIHTVTSIEGMEYYELHGNTHHHHIICTSCKKTACINCKLPNITVPGFTDIHHTVLVTGLCTSCHKKA